MAAPDLLSIITVVLAGSSAVLVFYNLLRQSGQPPRDSKGRFKSKDEERFSILAIAIISSSILAVILLQSNPSISNLFEGLFVNVDSLFLVIGLLGILIGIRALISGWN